MPSGPDALKGFILIRAVYNSSGVGKKTREAVADPGTVKGEVRCDCGWPCSEGSEENSCLK
ncbi:hypothetical protein Scep_030091 [Stephania cephalantha]|uniref:Uncharacterized protein n=1 Tax=Stephania cephalantha TaxID=152367 RepID=A0AAP0DYW3_9MAGN